MVSLKSFARDRSGNFAIMSALLAVPIFGAAGLAVDYTRAINLKTELQDEIDKLSLAIASKGIDASDQKMVDDASALLSEKMGFASVRGGVIVEGKWLDEADYQITGTVTVDTTLGKFVYGGPMTVSASSVARYKEKAFDYEAPEMAELDPEAHDYNEISVYCYDPSEANNKSKNYGRGEMVAIADNDSIAGDYKDVEMPTCKEGETLSLKLFNVRSARHDGMKSPDDKKYKDWEQYTYYSDTIIENNVESYQFEQTIVETVLCEDLKECVGTDKGGIIPRGKERDPEISTKQCEPNKYRYYGFEDRPPNGVSDEDYDDIRVIIKCPTAKAVGEEAVRLIR